MSLTAPTESTAAQEFVNLIQVRSPVVGNRKLNCLEAAGIDWGEVRNINK